MKMNKTPLTAHNSPYDTLKTKIMNNVIDIPKFIDEIDEDNEQP